jgi:hypothetical protein
VLTKAAIAALEERFKDAPNGKSEAKAPAKAEKAPKARGEARP